MRACIGYKFVHCLCFFPDFLKVNHQIRQPVQVNHQIRQPVQVNHQIRKPVQVNHQIRKPKLGSKFLLTEKQQAELCSRIFGLADVGLNNYWHITAKEYLHLCGGDGFEAQFQQSNTEDWN
ncbi:hypothetical protein JTE90_027721 [Oedothorax gibbosus]|uniref:Transposase putative helix-turn-helix domain-containing protein n=1 Tax=Oedothorax gibbosus TaxID=931172 RepID=A0AAV6UX74_9ARAC|nr:hypothetical protein JTE90_027721 [Oedothorax gibbosus]